MNKSGIQFDLAITSLAINDTFVAKKVLEIESEIDKLSDQLLMHTALGIRSPRDAEDYLSLFHIATAVGTMSDVAGNIAEIVVSGRNPFSKRNTMFLFMHEFIDAVKISENSPLVGSEEKDLDVQEIMGIDIMALRRGEKISLEHNIPFQPGDVLYLRGPLPNVIIFAELARGHLSSLEEARKLLAESEIEEPDESDLRPFEAKLLRMLDFASLMLDLSFLVHIESGDVYKKAVMSFEELIDRTLVEYNKDLMEAFKKGEISEDDAVGLLKLGHELEIMADAANHLAFGASKRKAMGRELLKDIIGETEEPISLIPIMPGSPFVGKTIRNAELETEVSGEVFDVIALRRKGRVIPFPDEDTILRAGDMLIIKTYQETDEEEEHD